MRGGGAVATPHRCMRLSHCCSLYGHALPGAPRLCYPCSHLSASSQLLALPYLYRPLQVDVDELNRRRLAGGKGFVQAKAVSIDTLLPEPKAGSAGVSSAQRADAATLPLQALLQSPPPAATLHAASPLAPAAAMAGSAAPPAPPMTAPVSLPVLLPPSMVAEMSGAASLVPSAVPAVPQAAPPAAPPQVSQPQLVPLHVLLQALPSAAAPAGQPPPLLSTSFRDSAAGPIRRMASSNGVASGAAAPVTGAGGATDAARSSERAAANGRHMGAAIAALPGVTGGTSACHAASSRLTAACLMHSHVLSGLREHTHLPPLHACFASAPCHGGTCPPPNPRTHNPWHPVCFVWQTANPVLVAEHFFTISFCAGEGAFMNAYCAYWAANGEGKRPPAAELTPGALLSPYRLWQEVWGWGGPAAVTKGQVRVMG